MSTVKSGRRDALRNVKALLGAAFGLGQDAGLDARRTLAPRGELVNVLEFEDVAKLVLPAAAYTTIAGSNRAAFDRMTFRPRMCIPTLDLDLSVELFGEAHFTPILVGPVAEQRQYHRDGELATVRGASAAKAAVILSSRSSVPLGDIAAEAKAPLWYAVYADGKPDTAQQIQQAVAAGCKALCITVGASLDRTRASSITRTEWSAIDQLRKGVDIPILIKGVLTTQDAQTAIAQGARGIVVSSYGSAATQVAAPLEAISTIADVVGAKAAVLVDGSFRRGSDILKALVLGAHAVLLARPVMWGLAAYGAAGVQSVIEMLQSDLGRHMGALGARNLESLNRSMVKIHRK